MQSVSVSGNQKYYKVLSLLLLAGFALLIIRFWNVTWDDSAITLGFSRNLVKYGDIIPSQYSDRVEGYSTFLWMLINSIFFRLGFDEKQVLYSAKILSTILTFTNIFIFTAIVRKKIKDPSYQILILVLYIFNGITLGSAVFGMETALYANLVLVSFVLFEKREQKAIYYATFCFASALLILVRHEGVLFLAPFALAFLSENSAAKPRKTFLYYWLAVFASYHIWHFVFFGEILTNPMMAKGHWPYQPQVKAPIDTLLFFAAPVLTFFLRYMVALVPAVVCIFESRKRSINLASDYSRTLFMSISLVGFAIMLLTQNNFPTAQRLSYPALPFLLLLLFVEIDKIPFRELIARSSAVRLLLLSGAIISAYNMFYSFRSPEYIITLDKTQSTAHVVTLLQEFLNKDSITYGAPDMGGLLLYEGDGKRIVDLGLLCNRRLATFGYLEYSGLEQYLFQEESVDIIEAHGFWLVPLAKLDSFFEIYIPAKVITEDGQKFFFIKRELLQTMLDGRILNTAIYNGNPQGGPNPGQASPAEKDAELDGVLLRFGTYVIIDLGKLLA